ncbi:MAG: hypothetical protein ABL903_14570 [Methylococcales bacterium]
MKTYPKKIILSAILLGSSQSSWSTDFYIRSGASGTNNGTNWTNAWSATNKINYASIKPGDTIYFAAGTYGQLSINQSGTSGNPITFKRATSGSHGADDTGWNATYDGRVIIDGGIEVGITKDTNFITIDGATRYGIWARNGSRGIGTRNGGRANNLTLRYLESGDPGAYKNNEDGIQGVGNNLIVEYCYIHDNDSIATHGDGIQWFEGNNIIIRYNIFKNNGQMTMLGEAAWSTYANDIQIYYNVFYNRGGTHYNGISTHLGSPQAGHFMRVYNNTFDLEAKDNSGYDSIFNIKPYGTVEFKNNAMQYSNVASVNQATSSYNGYDNSGQYSNYNVPSGANSAVTVDLGFVNVALADYHLTATSPLKGKGTNVGLTSDFEGNPVPTIPSIGAFESTGVPTPAIPGGGAVSSVMLPPTLKSAKYIP